MNIIGLNESLGIPFKYCGTVKSMHDHILEGVYQNLKDQTDFYLNTFSMFFNKTHHIKNIMNHNLSIKDIKKLIQYGNDASRNNIFTKMAIPKSLGITKSIEENDNTIHIVDILKQHHNVILYACGINDVMYEINACFYDVLNDKQKKKRALSMLQKNDVLEHVLANIEDNFKLLLSINSNTTIFVFNFSLELYTPNLILKVNKNWKSMNIVRDFVERYNSRLEELTKRYGLIYIDNRKQFHIKKRTKELIEMISNYSFENLPITHHFYCDNLGLQGFLEEQEKLLQFYKNTKNLDDKVAKGKIKEHTLEIDVIKKVMEENYEKNYH